MRPQDATRPAERVGTLPGHLPELPDPLAGRGRSEPTRLEVQPRLQDPARPQEAETTDGSAAVDWLLKGRR